MKKLFFFSIMLTLIVVTKAQTITLSFTGQDAANHHMQLSHVIVTNLSQNWQETIYWPDTTLVLNNGVGVNDHGALMGLKLFQNNPNPFNGTTDASLTVENADPITLEITDVNGRIVESRYFAALSTGTHHFRVTLSTAGTYVMAARQNGKTSSIKMINNGGGGENSITKLELIEDKTIAKSCDGDKSNVNRPWEYGDNLTIIGYATICGTECSNQFSKQLLYDETIKIFFPESITTPTVSSTDVSNISTSSVSVSSSVSGSCGVMYRGFCYGTSINPTIGGQHTTNGSGTGIFTSTLNGLTAGTTYYVRAYATNAAGTAYGDQTYFTTFALPAVTTNNISDITTNTASCGGIVTFQGSDFVSARGVCWSTSQNPTTSDNHTSDGEGIGSFSSNITGLSVGTTYYVRAYATNSVGTAYGNEVCFTTLEAPIVTTTAANNITQTSAYCGGIVVNNGGSVTARGVCWSTTHNPTTSSFNVSAGNGSGIFTTNLTGLSVNTTYYARAYALVNGEIIYGDEISFTTFSVPQPCSNISTFVDIDSNTYNTVQIGNQCWMKENLRTTKYADGTTIAQGQYYLSFPEVANWYYPYNGLDTLWGCGLIYNWKAVMRNSSSSSNNPSGVQGICPTGWHVPSDAEWTQLTDYVSNHGYACGDTISNIAKAMANTSGWINTTGECTIGNNPNVNNATGFSVIPNQNDLALFWSTTKYDNYSVYIRKFSPYFAYVNRTTEPDNIQYIYSVRCVRNLELIQLPSVTTDTVNDIAITCGGATATCGGNVTSEGGATVAARGVCWSTSHNPTTSDSHTTNGLGSGFFTSSITGLTQELTQATTYYVRAYATNSAGTAYGNEVSFTIPSIIPENDAQPCSTTPTITDIDGNVYNTVQIGQQCWMKENLRTTKYADNTEIPIGSTESDTIPYRYVPNNDESNVLAYGYLYNWAAVMHGASSSGANPSGVQGICPTGWHVPSDAEWTQLINYVGNQSGYLCGCQNSYIAKALADSVGWNSYGGNCTIGNNLSSNNATGFSARPTGYFAGWEYFNFGNNTSFASSRESNTSTSGMYCYTLSYNYNYVVGAGSGSCSKAGSYAVRCVRSEIGLPTVTTTTPNNITDNSAICGGNVIDNGSSAVTARGVCWSTSSYPTIADSHTADGTGTGNFISSITGLPANTAYYIRAYSTNYFGTVYGTQKTFITLPQGDAQPCPGAPTVTDIDGNVYNTVKIGQQCWMKENLRTKKYANGTAISQGHSSSSSTTAYWYYPNNTASNISNYGLLYNWKAVMLNASSSSSNPSGVQGVCPTGWHVPSDAEWSQLLDYVSNKTQYLCNSHITKALADTMGWNNSHISCTPGNNPEANNLTNFSARSAGRFYHNNYSIYDNFGDSAYFWSTHDYNNSAYIFVLYSLAVNCSVNATASKSHGYSVRCIKN